MRGPLAANMKLSAPWGLDRGGLLLSLRPFKLLLRAALLHTARRAGAGLRGVGGGAGG